MSQNGFLDKVRAVLISTKIRFWDNSFKLKFSKRKSNRRKKGVRENSYLSTTYSKEINCVYIDFTSADEKLRSIGSKQSHRADVPKYDPEDIERNTIEYPRKSHTAPAYRKDLECTPSESASKMADRNTSKTTVFRQTGNQNKTEVKRRSRSAGPPGKSKQRNSVDEKRFMAAQEKKNKASRHYQRKQQQNKTRHSMYNEPISDKEGFPNYLGSSSGEESEDGQKKWIKNPLNVKKGKKNQNEKRKSGSYDNSDKTNGKINEIKYRNVTESPEIPRRDYYREVPDKNGNGNQRGKFQRLEELRKKRIDITVTSDEEFNSPATRISRLRQRALQGARGSVKLPDTLDEWDIVVNKPQIPEKPRHLEVRREVKVHELPVENGSSSSEQISLRQIGPGVRTDQKQSRDVMSTNQNQSLHTHGPYRKIPKQDSAFLNSQNVGNSDASSKHFDNPAPKFRELPSGGVARYIALTRSENSVRPEAGCDDVISFSQLRTNEPIVAKKAIDRVEKKRKSNSDDSLDDLIESNIQYLESEIESGKLKRITEMQPGNFPVDSSDARVSERARSSSWEGSIRTSDKSYQNEVKLRLQVPATSTYGQRLSPRDARYGARDNKNYSPNQTYEVSRETRKNLSLPSEIRMEYQSHMFQNTVPKVERKFQSATHSPYLSRKSTELTEMEDLSKSDSQLSEHTFNYQRPSSYLHPQFREYQNYGAQRGDLYSRPVETVIPENVLKSMSVPVMESGMFSDVDYDIEVSERIKKWEKFMKKRSDGSSEQSLTTITESESITPAEWQVEPEAPVPIPQTLSFTSASVTVTRAPPPAKEVEIPQRPASPVTVKTYFEPKVQSSENAVHRIFRVVQDPRCCKAVTSSSEPQLNWVQSPLIREKTPYDNRNENDQDNNVTEESVLRPNITSKQGWPPPGATEGESARRPSRLSRFEDELNELQDIKVETVSDLRKRFDSDASGNESTDVTETPATPVRMTPLRQRRQFAQISTQPQPQKAVEKRMLPPQAPPPLKVYERKVDKISIAPQVSAKPDTDVWSPNLESKKGLVSIERVTARTLQTIPFSEDPIWREIEEMTNIDKLLSMEGSKDENQGVSYDPEPHAPPQKDNTGVHGNPDFSSFKTETKTSSKIFAPSGEQQVIKTRPFITPKIQPLKLSMTAKNSVDALDEVLEDIRHSLQKKSSTSDITSPSFLNQGEYASQTMNQSFFPPNSQTSGHPSKTLQGQSTHNVVSAAYTHYDPNHYRLETFSSHEPKQENKIPFTAEQPMAIDPEFTQFPYIINGNYKLDPDLLKQKLIGTGLAEDRGSASETESARKFPPPPPPERRHFPLTSHNEPVLSSNIDPGTSNAEEEVLRSMEELKKLAEDVELKLRQIKSRIIETDESSLDSIVLALRKFAPSVNPKFDSKTVENTSEHNSRKTKLQDALSELERIYDSLDLGDEQLLDRAERRETTLPRTGSQPYDHSVQKAGLKRNFSDSDYVGTYGAPYSQNDNTLFQVDTKNDDLENVEFETQKEFESINKSFETLLAEVSAPPENKTKQKEQAMRDEHVAEINATLDTFLGKFRRNECENTNLMDASELAERIKGAKSPMSPTSNEVSLRNARTDVMKSEVFTATSGPFSVLVGINGNPRKPKAKVKKVIKKSETSSNSQSSASPDMTSSGVTKTSSVGVQNSSSNESGSKESESESTSKPQVLRRPKRSSSWQHRKSMPADMLKKSVETQTIDPNWVSPVAVMKEKFQSRNDRDVSVSSENSDSQGPRKKQIAKGIAMMMEFFSSSEDERGRRMGLSHSHSAPDLMEIFSAEPKKSEKVSSPTSNRPLTPRSVKQRHEARSRKRSTEIQGKSADDKTDEFSVTSATSDDGQKSSSKPPRHPGLRKQKSSSPDKSDVGEKIHSNECNVETNEPIVVLREKPKSTDDDVPERPKSFHELLEKFESDKGRLSKMKNSLRKCASADSVSEQTIFKKTYSSEPDLRQNGPSRRSSDSGMRLQLEIKVKS